MVHTETGSPRLPSVLEGLPPFPAVAMRVMQLVSGADVHLKELSDLIISDQSFSAQVLRLANSPMFGFRTEIRGILQAVVVLGVERIKALAFTAGMQTYLAQALKDPILAASWKHSLATAITSEKLGRISLIEEDFSYTAGLLHDIGRLALITVQPARYSKFVMTMEKDPADVLEREREWFGVDHCEAGRWIVGNWRLPQIFGSIAELHHGMTGDQKFDIVSQVSVSCNLADALGFPALKPQTLPDVDEILKRLPDRERKNFVPCLDRLVVDINLKINSVG